MTLNKCLNLRTNTRAPLKFNNPAGLNNGPLKIMMTTTNSSLRFAGSKYYHWFHHVNQDKNEDGISEKKDSKSALNLNNQWNQNEQSWIDLKMIFLLKPI